MAEPAAEARVEARRRSEVPAAAVRVAGARRAPRSIPIRRPGGPRRRSRTRGGRGEIPAAGRSLQPRALPDAARIALGRIACRRRPTSTRPCCAPPPTEIRQKLKKLALESQLDRGAGAAETAMGMECGRGWLDLQRYVGRACYELGSYYEPIRRAVISGLRALLADYPQLPGMTMMDDTPTANAKPRRGFRSRSLPRRQRRRARRACVEPPRAGRISGRAGSPAAAGPVRTGDASGAIGPAAGRHRAADARMATGTQRARTIPAQGAAGAALVSTGTRKHRTSRFCRTGG